MSWGLIIIIASFSVLILTWAILSMYMFKEERTEYYAFSNNISKYQKETETIFNMVALINRIGKRINRLPLDVEIEEVEKELALLAIQKKKLDQLELLKERRDGLLEEVELKSNN